MKSLKKLSRFGLIAILALGAASFTLPRAGAEMMGAYSWEITPQAQANNLAGACDGDPNGYTQCREECFTDMDTETVTPQGKFRCFPD